MARVGVGPAEVRCARVAATSLWLPDGSLLHPPRERGYGSAPKPRGGRARRCAGGRGVAVVRWPVAIWRPSQKAKTKKAPPFGHSHTATQKSRIQKQKGPVASRQRRLVAAVLPTNITYVCLQNPHLDVDGRNQTTSGERASTVYVRALRLVIN